MYTGMMSPMMILALVIIPSRSDESEAGAQDFYAGTDDANASVESNIKLMVNKADWNKCITSDINACTMFQHTVVIICNLLCTG